VSIVITIDEEELARYREAHTSPQKQRARNATAFAPKQGPQLPLGTDIDNAYATMTQVAWLKLRGLKVDLMLWVSLALVVVLGGLTVWFHSETFIKWKPTLLYWAMAAGFALGPLLFGKNLLRVLMGEQLVLPAPVWQRLNWAWIAFFTSMGALNLWVAYHFSTDTWVNFKLFGSIGLMLVFTVAQGLYLSRYLPEEPAAKEPQ